MKDSDSRIFAVVKDIMLFTIGLGLVIGVSTSVIKLGTKIVMREYNNSIHEAEIEPSRFGSTKPKSSVKYLEGSANRLPTYSLYEVTADGKIHTIISTVNGVMKISERDVSNVENEK